MVDNFHKPQENIRLRVYCGVFMLAFRYIDHQEGHCSGIFSSWPWKALELIQWVGPKTMAECSFPLHAQAEEWGGGTARAAGIEHSARHPDLLLYTGSLNRDRHLSPKTPSLYLETLTQFEKRWCVHIAFFLKNSFNKYLPRIYCILRIGRNRKMNKTHHSPQRADYRGLFTSREKGPSVV